MNRLEGQVAIITGGAKGIGQGICEVFCREGASVVSWDVLEEGQQVAEAIAANGGTISFRKVDITDREDVKKAVAEVIATHGKIDVLINNAGIIRDRSFMKMTEDEWDSVLNVNLTGIFNVTKAVLPYMREANYGRIVSASSINGALGAFGQTNYSATKAGIIGFTKALSKEVGKYGITVNAVAPGFIKTDMTDSMPEAVVQAGIAQIPVRRIGTPEDMAYAYLFLASKEAGFVSGHTLHANGGAF
ncbi:MAG: beta-ketoacyl-ACP reductase [Bacteroidota bacterium]